MTVNDWSHPVCCLKRNMSFLLTGRVRGSESYPWLISIGLAHSSFTTPHGCVALWGRTRHYCTWLFAGDAWFHEWCKCRCIREIRVIPWICATFCWGISFSCLRREDRAQSSAESEGSISFLLIPGRQDATLNDFSLNEWCWWLTRKSHSAFSHIYTIILCQVYRH